MWPALAQFRCCQHRSPLLGLLIRIEAGCSRESERRSLSDEQTPRKRHSCSFIQGYHTVWRHSRLARGTEPLQDTESGVRRPAEAVSCGNLQQRCQRHQNTPFHRGRYCRCGIA